MEYLGVDNAYPDWNIWDHFVLSEQQRALYADSLSSTHAVMSSGDTPYEISSFFGAIIYRYVEHGFCLCLLLFFLV